LELLCQLEQLMKASGDYSCMLLEFFASDVDKLFDPIPPQEALSDFAEKVMELQKTDWNGDTVSSWIYSRMMADTDQYESLEQLHGKITREDLKSKWVDFEKYIRNALNTMVHVHTDKYEKYPVLHYFNNVLKHSLTRGRFCYLAPRDWKLLQSQPPQKHVLQWTAIGSLIGVLIGNGFLEEVNLYPKRDNVENFQELATITIPHFGAQLIELQSAMTASQARAAALKAQILAYSATALITMGQFAANYFVKNYAD